jgi:hypothetical protein
VAVLTDDIKAVVPFPASDRFFDPSLFAICTLNQGLTCIRPITMEHIQDAYVGPERRNSERFWDNGRWKRKKKALMC